MTRDEARIKYKLQFERDITIALNVARSFEKRTCKSCKYFTSSPNTNKYDCCEKGISDASISFCCNKWEAKI